VRATRPFVASGLTSDPEGTEGRGVAADPGTKQPLDALQALLATSSKLLEDLVADPLVDRVLRAFLMLPARDREPILRVLEKDAAWRRIVERTEDATGIRVAPNPHASLYVHVLDGASQDPSARDANGIRQGVESLVAMLPLLFQPTVHAMWSAAAREVAAAADAEHRVLAARLAREVLALLADIAPNGAGES